MKFIKKNDLSGRIVVVRDNSDRKILVRLDGVMKSHPFHNHLTGRTVNATSRERWYFEMGGAPVLPPWCELLPAR